MNAVQLIKTSGIDYAKHILSDDAPLVMDLDYNELKRLVESYELVESCGGIKSAKKEADCLFDNDIEGRAFEIYEAIEDVEKCQ